MIKIIKTALRPGRNRAIESKGLLALKQRALETGDLELYDWAVKGLKNGVIFIPSEQLRLLTYGQKPNPDKEE